MKKQVLAWGVLALMAAGGEVQAGNGVVGGEREAGVCREQVEKRPVRATTEGVDWETFLAQHDMYWTELTADPVEPVNDARLRTGYYAGAIMGNGLLGTNLYKLRDSVYRLNVGRSDVTEARMPYNLYNSARLPIGYFTLRTKGKVTGEEMRLSLWNAETRGRFTTDKGEVRFRTYVHAVEDYIVFETETTGEEEEYAWDFVAQQAISPRQVNRGGAPAGYLNREGKSNPEPERREAEGVQLLVQRLARDTTFGDIARVYVVAWQERREGARRRIVATVAQEASEEDAVAAAVATVKAGMRQSPERLEAKHREWWHGFYREAAFLSFPETRFESFYWAQYYKFASTARPDKPVVDLQGVWPTWDTPWTSIWMNLNLQLTYSWQAKANVGFLAEPLWEALYEHCGNLRRNVTDIPGQEDWTDAACLPRTATYDFYAPLNRERTVKTNQYEAGNLTWTLFYYWQHCRAYGDDRQLVERLFPLLKSAVNLFFHIRTCEDGRYGLPPTASPEYGSECIGTNANYDLANLLWGLQTLIDIDTTYGIGDEKLPEWRDFLDRLVDFRYDPETGFKVSDKYAFLDTSHRHYSHLFMIYPYHLLDWENLDDRPKMELSVARWKGNQGYSRTGKAAMLASKGDGDGALEEMNRFFERFLKPNTLYAETGPVIETPMAAMATLHEFYLQDWGGKIRVFYGMPSSWKEAAFVRMRADGAFLVSATRREGKNVFIQVECEKGGVCRLQTGMPAGNIRLRDLKGREVAFSVTDPATGTIEVTTEAGDAFQIVDVSEDAVLPAPLPHPRAEWMPYGDGKHALRAAQM